MGLTATAKTGAIAVAMSGGVDSTAAAALLVEQGRTVIGVTAIMSPGVSRCCSLEDVEAAAEAARRLGIAHHVFDCSEAFERDIIQPFIAGYLAGRTPSPCPACNRGIKFGLLLERARALGAAELATGHYARRVAREGRWRLRRGVDGAKDQSYFLALLTPEQVEGAQFPLGELEKPAVVADVQRRGLMTRRRGESQELCFVGESQHGAWIDVRSFDAPGPGDIVDCGGRVLGRHRGIHHYTIGQRRGLGIAAGRPVFVVALRPETNTVVVGDYEEAFRGGMRVEGLSWLAGAPPAAAFEAFTQIRHNHRAAASRVLLRADGAAEVVFRERQFAVAPGQLAAFYDGDELIGGGWIARAEA